MNLCPIIIMITMIAILASIEVMLLIDKNKEEAWYVILSHVIYNYMLILFIALTVSIPKLLDAYCLVIPSTSYAGIMTWTVICLYGSTIKNNQLLYLIVIETCIFYTLILGMLIVAVYQFHAKYNTPSPEQEIEIEGHSVRIPIPSAPPLMDIDIQYNQHNNQQMQRPQQPVQSYQVPEGLRSMYVIQEEYDRHNDRLFIIDQLCRYNIAHPDSPITVDFS